MFETGLKWRYSQAPNPNKPGKTHKGPPGCPLNTLQEPAGSKALHEIVEEYAADQNAFVTDFIPTMEKMLANGYDAE